MRRNFCWLRNDVALYVTNFFVNDSSTKIRPELNFELAISCYEQFFNAFFYGFFFIKINSYMTDTSDCVEETRDEVADSCEPSPSSKVHRFMRRLIFHFRR